MRYIALLSAMIGGFIASLAIPAKPGPVTMIQPDGTEITVQIRGDERHHFYLSEDGYLLINKNDAYYYGNVNAYGQIVPSTILAKPVAKRTETDRAYLSCVDMNQVYPALNEARQINPARNIVPNTLPYDNAAILRTPGVGVRPNESFPVVGAPRSLVVLVEFKDKKFTLPDPNDYFTRYLHEVGFSDYGATGCVQEYFAETSNGIFRPEFDIFGPITLPENCTYYGGNDYSGNDTNPEKMVIHACQILDDQLDFSAYDYNGDGKIDNIYLFYAGLGEANGGGANTVWPHAWQVTLATDYPYIFDGVRLDRYACSNEWFGKADTGHPDGIGTFCHEFSHVLGLPDLYSTNYSGAFSPGTWSVIDYGPYNNNGRTPPLMGIFERNALGWLDPTEITGAMSAELPVISENVGFVINTSKKNEFFLLENRQRTGWDAYLPGHGMLIWHIDYKATIWTNNQVNVSSSHQYVDIEEADNIQSEETRGGDPFPGTAKVTEFTDQTTPSMKTWSNTALKKPITNIAEVDGLITFDVCGGGEKVVAGNNLAPQINNLYTPGASNGWAADNSQKLYTSDYVNYYGFAHLNSEFSFTTQLKDGITYGGSNGALSDAADAPKIAVGSDALYWCHVNLDELTYELTQVSAVGCVGAFSDNKQIDFTPTSDFLTWTGTVRMAPNDTWRISCNNDQSLTFGGDLFRLELGGKEFKADQYGDYTIQANFGAVPYTAAVQFERIYQFTERQPEALEASQISDYGFVANWNAMDDAVSYTLYLAETAESEVTSDIVDFTSGVNNLPNGWTSSSSQIYTTNGRYGEASPSLRLTTDANAITSPVYDGSVMSIKFWARGIIVNSTNYIEVIAGEKTYQLEINNDEGQIYTIDDIPEGVNQIQIKYAAVSGTGNLAVDDINVTWAKRVRKDAGSFQTTETSMVFDTLLPDTEYFYFVVATNDSGEMSLASATIMAKTTNNGGSGAIDAIAKDGAWVSGNEILSASPAEVYTVDGQALGSTPVNVTSGIYIVKTQDKVIKLIVK